MKKIDVFQTPKQTFFLSIEDWQVAICGGDKCAAALLDFFTKRHKYYLESCEESSPRNIKAGEKPEAYQKQSLNKMNDYTLGLFGRNKLINGVNELIKWGFLTCVSDSKNNKSYLLLTEPVQKFIDEIWTPFLKTVDEKQNPLQSYLKELGYSRLKPKKGVTSLISNDYKEDEQPDSTRLISNDHGLISNEQTAISGLISNEASLISNEYIVTISNKDDLVTSSNNNSPDGVFSDSNLEDYEKQLADEKAKIKAGKLEAKLKAKEEKEKKKLAAKKKSTKWNGSFQMAKDIFDEQRKNWSKRKFDIDGLPIYWNQQEIGQLSNLLTALKSQAIQNGDIYEDDRDFVQAVLPGFLSSAGQMNKYYMNEFTPTRFYSNFNTVLTDVKSFLQNGNIPTKRNNGHNFDPIRTAHQESLLDP